MGLSEIADGLEVTTEQRDRGVATIDGTDTGLATRLSDYEADLPCAPETAATVIETHASGRSVGESGRAAGLSPITAAKTLHLLGVAGQSPVGPTGRKVIRDWLDGDLSRSDALALANVDETEFALATYVESHESIDGAVAIVDDAMASRDDAAVRKRDALAETMSGVDDLL